MTDFSRQVCRRPRRQHLHRWLRALALLLALGVCLDGCAFLKKKRRRFGSTCGQASECDSGLCYNGYCTTTCQNGTECASGVCVDNACQAPSLDFDNDGLTNEYEVAHGLNPGSKDSDNDELDDGTEIGVDLNHPKDSNFDGIPDALQSNKEDADGDCIVDAYDTKKGEQDPLPAAGLFCDKGVCKGNLNQVVLACDPTKTTGKAIDGCIGCVCTAPGVAGWQATETLCDFKDNDCNGQTDENSKLGDSKLGGPCKASVGACAALGAAGTVECGKNGGTICSTDGGGSQPSGSAELCNWVDDDCDGLTDEDFALDGAPIGQLCKGCAPGKLQCSDGQPFNPPAVVCGADGKSAVCGALPFASAFDQQTSYAPEPRQTWTAAWNEKAQKFHVFGGAIASAYGTKPRPEHWDLHVENAVDLALWALNPGDNAGARVDAALADDPQNTNVYLVGGQINGEQQTAVWRATNPGEWEMASGDGAEVAYLPDGTITPAKPVPAMATVLAAGGKRALVVVDGHYKKPLWHALGGAPGKWQPVNEDAAEASADAVCLARTGNLGRAVLAQADGTWRYLQWDGAQVAALPMAATGDVQANPLGLCAVDGDGSLHSFGGQLGAETAKEHRVATLPADLAAEVTFAVAKDSAAVADLLGRSTGAAAYSASLKAIVIGGGFRVAGGVRDDLPAVQLWKPSTGQVIRADQPLPRARFGHAMGYWPQQKTVCIAGGLAPEIPAAGQTRVRAMGDAWCLEPGGPWKQKLASGAVFAFGSSAIDAATQRLILVGGMALPDGQLAGIEALWSFSGVKSTTTGTTLPKFAPTNAVRAIELGNSVAAAGQLKDLNVAGSPYLAGAAFVHDEGLRRIVQYGGWGKLKESSEFLQLDLATMQWKNLGALLAPLPGQSEPTVPPPRYGAIAIYSPAADLFAITAGMLLDTKTGGVGNDYTGNLGEFACMGLSGQSHFWASRTLAAQQFSPIAYPFYANNKAPTKATTLLNTFGGGPQFVPVLFDPIGNRGWMAVPLPPQPASPSCPELGPASVNPLELAVRLTVDGGVCGGAPTFKLNPQAIDPVPEALYASAFRYVPSVRQGWIIGGLRPDGTATSEAWSLGQACK